MLRTFAGFIIGGLCGAIAGAVSFAVAENFFGRGIGILSPSPILAAIIGVVYIGVPGLAVGAIVTGFRLSQIQSVAVGATVAVFMTTLFLLRNESRYFYESGYFDRDLFWSDVITNATWLIGLPVTALIARALVNKLFAQSN